MILMWIDPIMMILKKSIYRGFTIEALISILLATPVQFWFGKSFYLGSFRALKHKSATMDVLIAVGTSAAYFYSIISIFISFFEQNFRVELFFETSAVLITFVLLGRFLENLAKGKTSEAITKLLQLQPDTATLVTVNEKQEEVESVIALDLVKKGDILKVLPGEKSW